jgi:hypothetical protein
MQNLKYMYVVLYSLVSVNLKNIVIKTRSHRKNFPGAFLER